jgi:hypothetical protein
MSLSVVGFPTMHLIEIPDQVKVEDLMRKRLSQFPLFTQLSPLGCRALPFTNPCAILPGNADRRRTDMNPIETSAALFDQGYA